MIRISVDGVSRLAEGEIVIRATPGQWAELCDTIVARLKIAEAALAPEMTLVWRIPRSDDVSWTAAAPATGPVP